MSHFCLKQGQVLRASAAHLYLTFPLVPPPGKTITPTILKIHIRCLHSRGPCQCKFIGPKESVYILRVYLPRDLFGTRFSVLEH